MLWGSAIPEPLLVESMIPSAVTVMSELGINFHPRTPSLKAVLAASDPVTPVMAVIGIASATQPPLKPKVKHEDTIAAVLPQFDIIVSLLPLGPRK